MSDRDNGRDRIWSASYFPQANRTFVVLDIGRGFDLLGMVCSLYISRDT